VGDLDGVAPLGGLGQRHERARAPEQAGVHQGPFRLSCGPVDVDGLDLAHRLVVGGDQLVASSVSSSAASAGRSQGCCPAGDTNIQEPFVSTGSGTEAFATLLQGVPAGVQRRRR
jgi:hypothetical protein